MYQLTDSQRAKWSRQNVMKQYQALCAEMGLADYYLDIEKQLAQRRYSGEYLQDRYGISAQDETANMETVAEGIRMGDLACIELSVRYIEANVMSYRTGYVRGYMARYLKQADLTQDQEKRLAEVFLSQLEAGLIYPEFREYYKLFKKIGIQPYEKRLSQILQSNKGYIKRFARGLLSG